MNRLEAAEASYQEAEKLYDELKDTLGNSQLMERLSLYSNFAGLILRDEPERSWPDRARARDLLATAAQFIEHFRGLFGDPRERIRVQSELLSFFSLQVRLCLEIGHLFNDSTAFQEALEAAEASRSRALLDSLIPVLAPSAAPLELRDEFKRLRSELRRAQRRAHQEYETLQALLTLQTRPKTEPAKEPEEPGETKKGSGELELVRDQNERVSHWQTYIGERIPKYRATCATLATIDSTFNPDVAQASFRMANRSELSPRDKRTIYVHLEILERNCHALVIATDAIYPVKLESLTGDLLFEKINSLAGAQNAGGGTAAMRILLETALADVQSTLKTHLLTAAQ